MCVCVCVREREGGGGLQGYSDIFNGGMFVGIITRAGGSES